MVNITIMPDMKENGTITPENEENMGKTEKVVNDPVTPVEVVNN